MAHASVLTDRSRTGFIPSATQIVTNQSAMLAYCCNDERLGGSNASWKLLMDTTTLATVAARRISNRDIPNDKAGREGTPPGRRMDDINPGGRSKPALLMRPYAQATRTLSDPI